MFLAEQARHHNTKLREQCACLAPTPRERTRTLMPRDLTKLLRRPQTALRPQQRLFLTRKPHVWYFLCTPPVKTGGRRVIHDRLGNILLIVGADKHAVRIFSNIG